MDNIRPWWSQGTAPALDSHFHHGWAQTGLTLSSLAGGPAVLGRYAQATIKEEPLPEGLTPAEAVKLRQSVFVEKFKARFPEFRLASSDAAEHWSFIKPDGLVHLEFDGDAKVSYNAVTSDEEFTKAFIEWWRENTTKTQPKGRVNVLVTTKNGPDFRSMGIGGEPLIRENYPPDVLSGYDRIVRDLQAEDPSGRVAILDGPPGSGKTYLVRGLLDEVKGVVMVIVPANLVAQLAQPGMIPALVDLHKRSNGQPIVFLIEDADECLAPRMGDNMSSVSTILNLSDGILGKLLDIRLVCTTNQKHTELDEAIMRPGRLSASIQVGALEYEFAKQIYARLVPGKELRYDHKYTLAELYSKARNDGWEPPKTDKRRMGFGADADEGESSPVAYDLTIED